MSTGRLVHVHGVPLDLGGGRRGVDMGPSAIRIAGLGERLAAVGCTVVDKGNLDAPIAETRAEGDRHKKYVREIARVCQKLYQRVYQSLEDHATPVVLGGDHSLAAGSVGAAADFVAAAGGEIGLLWVDAHGDMNTPASTSSGNVHGMPLAALLGPEPSELSKIGARSPKVRADKTVLIGIRNLMRRRRNVSSTRGACVHDERHRSRRHREGDGAGAGDRQSDTAGIHVSFDLDVCDPTIAPESAHRSRAA
jgi:arginase